MENKYLENLYAAFVSGSIADGRKVVTTAGTRVQVATASTPCRRITISALDTNTNVVVVGTSTCVAAAGTRRGIQLLPGASVDILLDDLNKLYLDSVTNGEGITYAYFL